MHSQLRETDDTTAAYDADDFLWLQETRGQLARRDFAGVDLMHLLEEIDDLSRREQRKLKHLLSRRFSILAAGTLSGSDPRGDPHHAR